MSIPDSSDFFAKTKKLSRRSEALSEQPGIFTCHLCVAASNTGKAFQRHCRKEPSELSVLWERY